MTLSSQDYDDFELLTPKKGPPQLIQMRDHQRPSFETNVNVS